MSDDDPHAYNRNYNKRIAQELAEADEPRNRQQAFLDRWWESQRAFEEETNDAYMVGGFMEHHSTTPSYTKGRDIGRWMTSSFPGEVRWTISIRKLIIRSSAVVDRSRRR